MNLLMVNGLESVEERHAASFELSKVSLLADITPFTVKMLKKLLTT